MALDEGMVIREFRGVYDVETAHGVITCNIRSRLHKRLIYPESESRRPTVEAVARTDTMTPVAVGDRVRLQRMPDDTGVIEAVLPRRTKLSRVAPGRRTAEQVIIANADQLVIVFAVKEPTPRLRLLDRFLIAAELGGLVAIICLNKIDLYTPDLPDIAGRYTRIGYRVILTSARTGQGIDALCDALKNRLSAIAGPSGVGKSSLLNRIQPGLGIKVQEISEATGKGRHTTSGLAAYKLDTGGRVIDTPGIREFGLWAMEPARLPVHFPEIRPYLDGCRFLDCAHIHEPDCAVKAAVEEGAISQERYESYIRLREELEGEEG